MAALESQLQAERAALEEAQREQVNYAGVAHKQSTGSVNPEVAGYGDHQVQGNEPEHRSCAAVASTILPPAPDPPHLRDDYREVWLSGWRAGVGAERAARAPDPPQGTDWKKKAHTIAAAALALTDELKAEGRESDSMKALWAAIFISDEPLTEADIERTKQLFPELFVGEAGPDRAAGATND